MGQRSGGVERGRGLDGELSDSRRGEGVGRALLKIRLAGKGGLRHFVLPRSRSLGFDSEVCPSGKLR